MTVRPLLVACCVLASADSILAQSSGLSADPISGTWTGVMGQSDTLQSPITLELKFDGATFSGTVTGPPNPGEIKTGTFDPKTGALKFDVNVKDSGNTVVAFEGTLVQGVATGHVSFNNQTGYFKMTKGAGGPSSAPGGSDMATALREGFGELSGWVSKAAEIVPADKYSYRPAASVRTFGQLVAHVVDGQNYFCARAAGRNVQWSDVTEKGSTGKAVVAQKLKESIEACKAAYGASEQPPLVANLGHTSLHYGNIITYMRMLGLVPPSTQ